MPQLREASAQRQRLVGAWQVGGTERVRALEDELTALAASAPEDRSGARAVALRDAVRAARQRIEALTVSTPLTVDDVRGELEAVTQLVESALAATPTPPTPT
jgi:hypothetical protein